MTLLDSNILLAIINDERGPHREYANRAVMSDTYVTPDVVSEVTHKRQILLTHDDLHPMSMESADTAAAVEVRMALDMYGVKSEPACFHALDSMCSDGLDFTDWYLYMRAINATDVLVATSDKKLQKKLGELLYGEVRSDG